MNHLKEVREAVIKAVPEAESYRCYNCGTNPCEYTSTGCPVMIGRSIQLADVLRALQETEMDCGSYLLGNSLAFFRFDDLSLEWNLAENLEEQKPETIEFLYNILLASLKQTV